MSSIQLVTNLNRYLDDCRLLESELRHAIEDVEYMKKGGQLYYAVDFTEIFVYALPMSTQFDRVIFSDGTESDKAALRQMMLRYLFTHSSKKLILLAPYAAELDNFMYRLYMGDFYELIEATAAVFDEIELVRQDPFFLEFAQESNDDGIPRDRWEDFWHFLVAKAPYLILLLEPASNKPLRRIRHLMARDVFCELRDVIDVSISINTDFNAETTDLQVQTTDDTFTRWCKRLLKEDERRGDRLRPTYRDAYAMTLIEAANRKLRDQNAKIVLVTRSTTMSKVFQAEFEEGRWHEAGDHIIRDPQVFNLIYRLDKLNPDDLERRAQELNNRHDTLLAFLNIVEQLPKKGKQITPTARGKVVEEANQILENIKTQWRSSEVLTGSIQEALELEIPTHYNETAKEPHFILSLLRDNKRLRSFVRDKLSIVAQSLVRGHDALGVGLYFENLPASESRLIRTIRTKKDSDALQINIDPQLIPYSIRFYTPEIRKQLSGLLNANRWSWSVVLSLFQEIVDEPVAIRPEVEYERLLAVSLILTSLKRAPLAMRYCKRAVNRLDNTTIKATEGVFFLNYLNRRLNLTYQQLKECLTTIENLAADQDSNHTHPVPDARFLKEKAVIILSIYSYFRDEIDSSVPPETVVPELLLRARQYCDEATDQILLVQIYNNLLFYYIERQEFGDRLTLQLYIRQIHELQRRISSNMDMWPPLLLDTLAWSQWKLNTPTNSSDIQALLRMLHIARANDELLDIEKAMIDQHYWEISRGADKVI